MSVFIRYLLTFSIFSLVNIGAYAQTAYVTDKTYVPLRSGQGTDYRIIHHGLKTGLKLEVIDAPIGSDWSQVRTPSGLTGWIKKQYLRSTPTAAIELQTIKAELAKTKQSYDELKASQRNLNNELNNLQKTSNAQVEERDKFAADYKKLKDLSEDAVNLSRRYQSLLAKHELVQTEFDAIQAENDRLKRDETVNKWITGVGILILGMILMLILPKLRPKKRYSDWA